MFFKLKSTHKLNNKTLYSLLRRLWQHISTRRRIQFGILFILMIMTSFAEVISIGAVLPFLGVLTSPERVFAHQLAQPFIHLLRLTEPKQLLLPLTLAFAFAALFSGAMRLVLLWAQTRLSYAIGGDVSFSMYRRTLFQPYAVHVSRNSSEIIAGVRGKANSVVASTIMPILTIISSSLILLAIMFALFAIEAKVAFAAFAGFGAIYMLVILLTRKGLSRDSHRINRESTQVIKALQEGLGGIRDVLIDGTQAVYCKIYRDADLQLRHAEANIVIIGSSPRFGIEALGMVLIAFLAYSLASKTGGLVNAIPILGGLALGAQRLMPVLQQMYQSWTNIRGGHAYLIDAVDMLDQPMPLYADEPLPTPITFKNKISLNKLTFRYSPLTPWVLKGLDIDIPKGSRIGFVGATGSGKSTLLDIIMGLLYPSEGRLAIDGVDITLQNHRSWQIHIAHVPQVIFLADSTIAENIAFGVPQDQIDFERVMQAAKKAQIAQVIETWKDKYQTKVGERGVRLSGGQRQRIGIARALYKKADVIVFDEATSALDNDTERDVMQAIESLGDELTILIVAHRLSTLKNCDQIVELSDGNVKKIGTYLEIVGNQT
jgi:ABC-type multidrug transport system fused ATPase/permease subunit